MTRSLWKLTMDPSGTPLVILDIGDMLDDELRFSVSKGLEVVDLEDSSAPFLRSRRNAIYEIEFERRIIESTDAAARAEVLNWQIELEDYGKNPLRCEYTGEDDYWTFANAFLTRATTYRKIADPHPALILSVSLSATSLTRNIVP